MVDEERKKACQKKGWEIHDWRKKENVCARKIEGQKDERSWKI